MMSCRIAVSVVLGGRAGSGVRMRSSDTADTANEIASTRIAKGALTSWTSAPARPGPPISASEELVASLLLPSTTRSTPISEGTYAGYAAWNSAPRHPSRNVTRYSCSIRSPPAAYAIGIESSSSDLSASVPIRSGLRRSRSTQAPAKNPTSRIARLPATTSRAISVGPAPRTSNATSGIAVRVTTDPSSEIV